MISFVNDKEENIYETLSILELNKLYTTYTSMIQSEIGHQNNVSVSYLIRKE